VAQLRTVLADVPLTEDDVLECLLHIANNPNLVEDGAQRLINQLHTAHKRNTQEEWNKVTVEEASERKNQVSWN
jgi:hypothetical protein